MVQLMGSLQFEDFSEEEYGSLRKRSRVEAAPSKKLSSRNQMLHVQPSEYNPLDEPSPLGLRLRKSLSFLDLVQTTLSQRNNGSISKNTTKTHKTKASNFPASLLRIGSWEYVSKYEGDLVAKFLYRQKKVVWEVLNGGLKSKIEIQWSEITAMKAEFPEDGPGSLTIVLARQPSFFRETNPKPRKHTEWQATTDFTGGQASTMKQHFLQCLPGVLEKHYEMLLDESDKSVPRLRVLSQQPEIVLDSPYFNLQTSVCENSEESAKGSPLSPFQEVASSVVPHLQPSELVVNPTTFPSLEEASGIVTQAVEGSINEGPKSWESLEVPGLRSSMSMTDLVNHIGNCISEQVTSGNLPSAKASECHEMLESISQVWLCDTPCSTGLDERSLMKKVNSLCSLLQDPAMASNDGENPTQVGDPMRNVYFDFTTDSAPEKSTEVNFADGPGLPRKDSFSDLLLHLPRIASLPKFSNFLYGIAEDEEYQWP